MNFAAKNAFIQFRAFFRQYRPFIGGAAFFSGSTSLGQAVMMLYAILLARVLGPEGYGTLIGVYSITSLSSILINWGMDNWLLREGGEKGSARALTGAVLKNKLLLGAVWGGALVLLLPAARPGFFTYTLTLICVIDIWSESCFNSLITGLNVEHRINSVSRLILFSRIGRLAGAVVIILVGLIQPVTFAFTRTIFTVLGLLLAFIALRPSFENKGSLKAWPLLRKTLPFGFSDFLAMIYMQADVTLLTLLIGKVATGTYSPASSLINALFIIPTAGYMLLVPKLAHKKNLSAAFRLQARQVIVGFSGLGVLMALGVGLFGGPVVGILLGDDYEVTQSLITMMSPILLFKSIEFGLVIILVVINWQQQRLIPQVLSAGINIILNILLIPVLNVYGAALVYIVSEVFLTFGYGWLLWNWYRQTGKQVLA